MGNENQVNFELVLQEAMKLPYVKIDRTKFLESELKKEVSPEMVERAIQYNPAYAGIPKEIIEKIAKTSINFETAKVSAISFAAGIPGGLAMLGTIPADITQYFAHVTRILQKLVYLYGWQDLFGDDGELNQEERTLITLFFGVMFGVGSANAAIVKIAEQMAANVAKKLPQKALTKGLVYPIVKKLASIIGSRMTKQIFADGVAKIVPVLGGVVSGGLTFVMYRPMALKFQDYLSGLKTADPSYYQKYRGGEDVTVEDIDFSEIQTMIEDEYLAESNGAETEEADVQENFQYKAVTPVGDVGQTCPKCGHILNVEAVFCDQCGTHVKNG